MATPNYTPAYRNYLTNTAGYVIPSNVRTYSVFDPASNSWKRMTNNGMSPMPMTPEQEQANIQAALRYAESARGKVFDEQTAQPLVPTQTPGIMLRPRTPAQAPAQTPLGGPRMASKPQLGGSPSVPAPSASRTSQRASESQIQVPAYDERIARERAAFGDPMAGDEFLYEVPIGVPGYQGKRPYVATSADVENVKQMFQESGPKFDQWGETYSPQQLRNMAILEHDLPKPSGTEVMAELFANAATTGTAGAIGGAIEKGLIKNAAKRAFLNDPEAYYAANNASRGFMRDVFRAQQRMNMTEQEAALLRANKFGPAQSEWISPTTPSVGAGLSRGTANYTQESAPRALDAMRKVKTYESPHAATSQTIPKSAEVAAKPTSTANNPARVAKTMGSRETNIGGRLSGKVQKAEPEVNDIWGRARNPERTGTWGGARQAARDYSQKMSENIASGPTQKVVINPNVRVQDITKKPGGMTIWDRYADSKNYGEGFLNPYMKYNYGSKLNIPFLPFTR